MQRKLLLLNPASPSDQKKGYAPLSLLTLGTHIARRFPNININIIDFRFERNDFYKNGAFAEAIQSSDVIGISCGFSLNYLPTLSLAKKIRHIAPKTPILIGGHHANALPEDFWMCPDLFDFVISGWGETAFEQIWNHLSNENFNRPARQVHVVGPPLPKDKADPPIKWSLITKYFQRTDTHPILWVKFVRGCTQQCHFCGTSGQFRYTYAGISPVESLTRLHAAAEFIAAEAIHDPKFYLANECAIDIGDELFGPTIAWRQSFLEGVINDRPSFPFDFDLIVHQRIDRFSQGDIDLYDRARANINFGLESMDPSVLLAMNKTKHPIKYLKCADRVLVHPSLPHSHTYYDLMFIFGFPSENIITIERSADGLRSIASNLQGPMHVNGAPFFLYPTSEVFLNRASYEYRFGSRFYFPNWWKESNALFKQAFNDPSRNFTFFDLYDWYLTNFPGILDTFYEKSSNFEGKPFFQKRHENLVETLTQIRALRNVGEQLLVPRAMTKS